MNSFTIILLSTVILYASAATDPRCAVCDLNGRYAETYGYGCTVIDPANVLCYCPGGQYAERNAACRPCHPPSRQQTVCNVNITGHVACLDNNDYGTGYICLCENNGVPYATTDYNCNPAASVTPRPTTTAATPAGGAGSSCANGGVLVSGLCQCPSGYTGMYCEVSNPSTLCRNVACKNNGVCVSRAVSGPYVALCVCRLGTFGDYCELNGTLGYCSASSCTNGAACQEDVVGSTRYAYCRCPPGYKGVKCETSYFTCTTPGSFPDNEMSAQGKYFTCTANANGTFRLEQKSCAKGLRFNQGTNTCGY